jgi:diphthine-ammonia ligase
VALANLKPSESSHKYELDSYMYQTVGYDGIKYISECMGVPLFQNDIVGDCIVSGLDYVPTKNDEVEDLYNLLLKIKTQFPEIEGVSVGAILSNFQRVRVENICNRLNLTPFAFLWRIEQPKILRDMIDSNLTAVLVKVAAIGLNESHLNKSLGELYDYFMELLNKYGNNVCGEGGEYETFTIDCPLFSKRIVVDEYDVNKYGEAFAPVCNLRFKKVHLEDKNEKPGLTDDVRELLLDNSNFKHLEIIPPVLDHSKSNKIIKFESEKNETSNQILLESTMSIYNKEPYLVLSGVTSTKAYDNIQDETKEVMDIIDETLKNNNYEWSNIILMTVYIKNMSEFGKVNAIYKEYFSINPPPRVCVSLNLPENKNISIDCVCSTTKSDKKQCMHVQSISYWAPANIGPYSQSVVVNGSGYIAGQIGLIPCKLELPQCDTEEASLASETQMSLHSLENIVSVLPFKMRNDSVYCTCYITDPSYFTYVQEEWKKFMKSSVPINYVCIPTLPKNSKVEWQLILYNKNNDLMVLTDEEELALELELEDIVDHEVNIKDDTKRECLEYQLTETLSSDSSLIVNTHGIRKTSAFHYVSSVEYQDVGDVYNQEILEKATDALFDGLSKGIQSLRMKDNAIQLKIFYLDSTPKSIISEVVSKKCETIHYYGSDKILKPSISYIPVLSLPENTLLSLHLYGFN